VSGETREESILRSLRRILRAVSLHDRQLQGQYQLTGPQLICLRHLRDCPQPPTAGELARALSLRQPTVTGLVDRLVARGVVLRRHDARDRRVVRVSLTPQGRELAWNAPLPLHERFAHRLSQLPDNAARQIDEVLQDVVQMMEADELEAAPVLATGELTAAASPSDADGSRSGPADDAPRSPPRAPAPSSRSVREDERD
jgi:DNA-binding MarR family transcriptional regulator